MRSRRDLMLPYIPFHHISRCQCSTSLRWFVCSRMLRCTGRSRRCRCTIEGNWTSCCNSDCYHSRNIPVACTGPKTHAPPHQQVPCLLLLPRMTLCPEAALDCSRPHTFCHPLLLDTRMDQRPSFDKNRLHKNNKSTLLYLCTPHSRMCKQCCSLRSRPSRHTRHQDQAPSAQ